MRLFNHHGLWRLALAIVAMATLSIATPSRAQEGERDRLAADVVASVFAALDVKTLVTKGMENSGGGIAGFESRPEWNGLLKDAMIEEIDHDMPVIQAILTREFAKRFTLEELKAGAVMLRDPAVRAIMAAGAAGEDEPENLRVGKEAERAAASKAGRSFFGKSDEIGKIFNDAESEFLGEVIPGTFRRFADKAEAAEAARR